MRLGGIRIGIHWFPRSAYRRFDMPLRVWIYSEEHDSGSFFWRIFGLEINIPKDQP